MSATETNRGKSQERNNPKKVASHELNPSYTVRVVCCVFFIFLTEIFLAHYIYRLINSEIRSEYVAKTDFGQYFLNELRSENFRDEVKRVLKDYEVFKSNNSAREKRSVKNGMEYNFLSGSQAEEAHVEFFDPKNRQMLEGKDEEIRRQTGNEGAAPGGDSWIWVTSSSRIPEKALEGYCQKVQEFCPKNPGPQGPPGPKGDGGSPGLRGFPGIPGDMGTPGFPGQKGEPGRVGLNGLDGIPGEPGLFGKPGRNGHDGLPGRDGIPGRDGKDGVNGMKGDRGPPGPQGPPGQRGLTGPRGKGGRPGSHGTPGLNGITAWQVMDKNNVSLYLVPPSIAGTNAGPMGPIIVHEGENVRLHCSATGTPTPKITWQRLDNRPINRGAWQDGQISAPTLNITRVNRDHMGTYLCIADNGVPPQANQTFILEVYFPPLVRISNQMVAARNGSTAVLECETEAFPEALRYWELDDGRLLENSMKYRTNTSLEKYGYKATMQLIITNVNEQDFRYQYQCVSKNELQTTRGELRLVEMDPKLTTPPHFNLQRNKESVVYGIQPPNKVSYEDLCGPPIQCPDCDKDKDKDTKCIPSGVSLLDLISRWEVRQFGEGKTYPGYPPRAKDCMLYAVGKPVYHRFTDHAFGSWMRDPMAQTEKEAEKYWVTLEDKPTVLYEYENKTMYRKNMTTRRYILDHPFGGNTHVIFNGFFLYNVKDTNRIIKFHLLNQSTAALDLPLPVASSNHTYTSKLYSGHNNHMDFSIDDNGLWVIFGVPDSNNTAVMKVDVESMKPQYIWNISIDHHKVGEMFIVCGVLYAVDSATDRTTKIRFAMDLYTNNLLDVNLSFSNPFRKTTMLGYNPRNQELYSWDKGNQLTYPVRYHDIGYNSTGKDEKTESQDNPLAQMQTGYTVF